MIAQLHEKCRELLASGAVKVVIGYGANGSGGNVHPVFVTRPDDVTQLVWNDRCFMNLAVYLTRKDVRAMGKPAIVVKGCDARALVVLARENQIVRENVVAIGMACDGVGTPRAAKCSACDAHVPGHVDVVIGEATAAPVDGAHRYADLEAFMARSQAERMDYWRTELARCVKCYACRQVCPLCYCERCIADKNRPQCIDTSASLKGNFAWQLTRSFHLAGRCVGCDECSRACPSGINLRLLNLSLARAAETSFGYRAGVNPDAEPIVGSYAKQDKETFIK